MSQQWLNVAGLMADFAGFCLLLREWWLAVFNEDHQIALEQQLERMQSLRGFAQRTAGDAHRQHLETAGRMQDDMAIRKAREAHLATLAARKTIFRIAAVLIVLGFLLQLAGSWPIG